MEWKFKDGYLRIDNMRVLRNSSLSPTFKHIKRHWEWTSPMALRVYDMELEFMEFVKGSLVRVLQELKA